MRPQKLKGTFAGRACFRAVCVPPDRFKMGKEAKSSGSGYVAVNRF